MRFYKDQHNDKGVNSPRKHNNPVYTHLTTEYQNMEAQTDRTVWNSKPTDPLVQLEIAIPLFH